MKKSGTKYSLVQQLLNEAAKQQLSETSEQMTRICVRPPFALPETDFLRACTHCAACLHACDYRAIHLLPIRCGFLRSGTPGMELSTVPCHLCKDWPCVTACETGALRQPAANELPELGLISVLSELCLASESNSCNECFDACPVDGAISRDDNGKPVINKSRCPGCAMCLQACVAEPRAFEVQYVV